jgi:hypothetical protein
MINLIEGEHNGEQMVNKRNKQENGSIRELV